MKSHCTLVKNIVYCDFDSRSLQINILKVPFREMGGGGVTKKSSLHGFADVGNSR